MRSTLLVTSSEKVKINCARKKHASKSTRSTKQISYCFEDDVILSPHSYSTLKSSKRFMKDTPTKSNLLLDELDEFDTDDHYDYRAQNKSNSLLDQFPVEIHPYIVDVVDVKADGHCGYRAIAALLGMGEDSWALVCMDLHEELCQWRQEYIDLFGGDAHYEYLKNSLLVDHMVIILILDDVIYCIMLCELD